MNKVDDIFLAKRAIEDLQKICKHYSDCSKCPLLEVTCVELAAPCEWDTRHLFKGGRVNHA